MGTYSKQCKTISLALIASALAVSCTTSGDNHQANAQASKKRILEQTFFEQLSGLCGQRFVGETNFPSDSSDSFAGKELVAHVKHCDETSVHIPFSVGEDRSRTWMITKTDKGLLLQHDHRHEDGTPDEVTMYGGFAKAYKGEQGSSVKQFFHADGHTMQLIPEAASNVWMLEYNADNQTLTYYLERHQQPRYKAILTLQP